ncbi:glycosyltransferase family 4 protein [Paenibacillus polymyxa]|uniref:glycosyltransferase family 4 protein n=1 Tax=Paenibacillus TaxID=44249 RepID=UPI0008D6B4E9|nr:MULTISPECIES: glycosyltransferase family 1 protein [Paenibacillus]RFT96383.1 glycosyltransferase family 1 protein [Paenibacillus jamilae]SEI66824.1 Glycosyltransferase involved in cell wall bisynthesis [Paenibacillus polymyxa]
MLRVALFTDTYTPDVNGAALTLERWIGYLETHGVSTLVFAPEADHHLSSGPGVERFRSIPFLLYRECRLAIPNAKQINERLSAFSPHLIHVATPFNLGLYGTSYAAKHHIPLVASYHTHFDKYLEYYKLRWLEPALWRYMLWFHRHCERVYVPSRSTMELLRNKGMGQLEIWGRGIDTDRFQPTVNREAIWEKWGVHADAFVILYVGRLAPEKGIDTLLDSYLQLPDDVRAASVLVIAGDGPLFKYKTAADIGVPEHTVHWLGFVKGAELAELYAAADVFLFPSTTETFGNVVLEAMASGTPVIGANEGGVKDNIIDGKTGLLCPAGDAAAFAKAVLLLYEDAPLRDFLSRTGRAYSLEQTWDRIFERLLDSYMDAATLHLDSYPVTRI